MGEHGSEQHGRQLDNPEFFSKIKEAIATKFDDLATNPRIGREGIPLDLGERIRRGEKIPKNPFLEGDRMLSNAIAAVCGDLRIMDYDLRDEIKKRFLEK